MASGVNKIHVNNSTRISLNDRFTIMQSVGGEGGGASSSPNAGGQRRSRARSRSRSRGREPNVQMLRPQQQRVQAIVPPPKPSILNRYRAQAKRDLYDNLRAGRQTQMALRLKMKNMALQRLNAGGARRALPPQARVGGRMMRTNSLAKLSTMKADQLRRSNTNLAGRLGMTRRGTRGVIRRRRLQQPLAALRNERQSRPRLRRADSRTNVNMTRARSRSTSRANLNRSNSQSNLRRSNSRQSLNRGVGGQQQQLQQQQQRRKINRNFQGRARSNSVSNRLGRTNSQLAQQRGGFKRGNSMGRGAGAQRNNSVRGGGLSGRLGRVNQGGISKQQRLGRPSIRGNRGGRRGGGAGQQVVAGRGGNMNRNGARNGNQQNNNRTGGGRSRSRSRTRNAVGNRGRGGAGRGGGGGKKNNAAPKSKEDLDKELDQYMADTKPGF